MWYSEHSFIFITDDDADDREFLISALQESGFRGNTVECANGIELIGKLEVISNKEPGMIVLDLNMPVMNGYDTLATIKSDARLKNIPVIILSATTKSEDETACFGLGCADFIKKPMAFGGYKSIARKILDGTAY